MLEDVGHTLRKQKAMMRQQEFYQRQQQLQRQQQAQAEANRMRSASATLPGPASASVTARHHQPPFSLRRVWCTLAL